MISQLFKLFTIVLLLPRLAWFLLNPNANKSGRHPKERRRAHRAFCLHRSRPSTSALLQLPLRLATSRGRATTATCTHECETGNQRPGKIRTKVRNVSSARDVAGLICRGSAQLAPAPAQYADDLGKVKLPDRFAAR